MKAYTSLALQYFYLGRVAKSSYYNERAQRGKVESTLSGLRKIAQDQYYRREKQIRLINVHIKDNQHFTIRREGGAKIMDYTMSDYSILVNKICKYRDGNSSGKKKPIDKMMPHIIHRKMGLRLIRMSTPLH